MQTSFFSEFNPVPHFFFHLKSFQWRGPLTVKVRKNSSIRFWATSSFCIEIRAPLGHIFLETPKIYLFQDGPFRGCLRMCVRGGGMGQKEPPLTSYIDETWHSYTLPKEDPKNT